MDAEYVVLFGDLPRIGTGSIITGDAVVEFMPPTTRSLIERFDGTGGSPKDGILDENEQKLLSTQIKDGDFLSGGTVTPNPLDAIINIQQSFGSTFATIDEAGRQVAALALDLRKMTGGGEGEIQKIAQKMALIIDNFNNTMTGIDELVRDSNLKETLQIVATRLPELVDEAENVMQQAGATLGAFEGVGRAAEETVQNISALTKPLGENGAQIVEATFQIAENANGLIADMRKTMATVEQVAARVNNGQGTIAKLIDDPELYYTLLGTLEKAERALENVETLSRRLHPIVEDVRVLTSKVSRDPSILFDVKGVLTRRPRGAGLR